MRSVPPCKVKGKGRHTLALLTMTEVLQLESNSSEMRLARSANQSFIPEYGEHFVELGHLSIKMINTRRRRELPATV